MLSTRKFHIYLNLQLLAAGLFKYVWPFLVDTRHKRVKSLISEEALFYTAQYPYYKKILANYKFKFLQNLYQLISIYFLELSQQTNELLAFPTITVNMGWMSQYLWP